MFCGAVCPHGLTYSPHPTRTCPCSSPTRGRSRKFKYDGFTQTEVKMLQRKAAGMTHQPAEEPFKDMSFIDLYPTLSEYLFQGTWEDGSIRSTATLMFFAEGVVLKGVLNDRAFNRSAFVTDSTFNGLLAKIEVGLVSGNLDWRVRKQYNANSSSPPF